MIIENAGIYHDPVNQWQVSRYHFKTLEDHDIFFRHEHDYQDVDEFISSEHEIKFAAYHVPFPHDENWLTRFHKVYPYTTHNFVFCSELHQITLDQMRQLDLDNVSIFIAGVINQSPFSRAKVYPWIQHLETTSYFYKNNQPNFIKERYSNSADKEKYFDILLGCRRPHRDFVFNYIQNNNLNNQVIMTYHRFWNQDLRLSTEFIMEDDGIEFIETPGHTIHSVKYNGHIMCLSQVIPLKIYNNTHYTLVTETNALNEFNFYTEKIWKPIIAGRLFVVIAGQHFLKNLRDIGFKTFDGVIDESYDQEPNSEIRWQRALEQLNWLCQQDPTTILKKIEPIVKYNQQLVHDTDWHDIPKSALANIINQYIR